MQKFYLCLIGLVFSGYVAAQGEVTVYKSPTCGCCKKWISHMEENGFKVKAVDMNNVTPKKIEYGIGNTTASCHTAVVDGYVIEGHVPASDVKRLLAEKPANIRGLAAPGMPSGSPGMEQGGHKEHYTVVSIDKQGKTSVYARH